MKFVRNRSIAIGIAASLLVGFGIGFGVKGAYSGAGSAHASEPAPVTVHKVPSLDDVSPNKMLSPNLWDIYIDPLFTPIPFLARPLPVLPLMQFSTDVAKVQTKDGDKELQVIAQVPGMNEKDVDVQVSDDAVTIKGHKVSQQKDSGSFASTDESFQQTLHLPCKIVADKVRATVKDGILTVSLPKVETTKKL